MDVEWWDAGVSEGAFTETTVLTSPGAASAGTVTGQSLNDPSGVEGPNTCSSQQLRFHECPQSSHL